MKKLLFAAIALCFAVNANAQFGIIGGLTSGSTTLSGAYSDLTSKSIAQYHVGITYKIGLGNILAIQPSLIYDVKGAKLSDVTGTASFDFSTGYIELPVQIQAGVGIGSILRLYGIAEPFIGYAVSNKVKVSDLTKNTWDNVASRFEYGIGLGAGVELFKHIQVSARYYWNLGNVYDFSWTELKNAPKGACNGITASVAFLF